MSSYGVTPKMVVLGKRMTARKTRLRMGEALTGQRVRLNELLRHPLRGQDSAAFLVTLAEPHWPPINKPATSGH